MEIEYNKKLYQAAEELDVNLSQLIYDFKGIFENEKVTKRLDHIQDSFNKLNDINKSIPIEDQSYIQKISNIQQSQSNCRDHLKKQIEELKNKMKQSDEILKQEMNNLQKLKLEKKQQVEESKKKADKEFRQELLKIHTQ